MANFKSRRMARRAGRLDPAKSQDIVNRAVKGAEPAPPKKEPAPVDDSRQVGTQNGRPYTMGQARGAIDAAVNGRPTPAPGVAEHPSEQQPRSNPGQTVSTAMAGARNAGVASGIRDMQGQARKKRLSQITTGG